MTLPEETVARLMESAMTTTIKAPCQASIWLLGAAATCSKEAGHEGRHEVRIEWSIG